MKFLGYQLIYAVTWTLAWILCPFSRKLRRGLWERRGLNLRVRRWRRGLTEAPFWFHVASSGELEQSLPILEEIKRRSPKTPIFLSYFSPTGKDALRLEAERRLEGALPWDYADYSPFDFSRSADRFVKALSPCEFIAIHREVWPGILKACMKKAIPRSLFAAYFPSPRPLGLMLNSLGLFGRIATTEPFSAERLRRHGLPNTECLGDPRIERVLSRKSARATGNLGSADGNILVLASVWPQDLRAVAAGVKALISQDPQWRVVVVPHEPGLSVLAAVKDWGQAIGIEFTLFSQAKGLSTHTIINRVGILADLYEAATLVFVGGSFKNRVHNVLEPAAYGKPILTGPFIENSGEAVALQRGRTLYAAKDSDDFASQLLLLAEDAQLRVERSAQLTHYLLARTGASSRYADLLLGEKSGP